MSNKTNRLAKNLLAAMSLLGVGGAVMPGVSAAEKAATTKTETKAKAETGKKEAAKPAANANKGMNPIITMLSLVGGFGAGMATGKLVLGGGSGDIKAADGKVDYDMTALVKISQGETQKLLGDNNIKANIVKGDYQSIAYAVAEACNVYAAPVGVNAAPAKVANIAQLGKKVTDETVRVNGLLANGTLPANLNTEIGSIEWNFGTDKLNLKDAGTPANRPMNDLMVGILNSNPLLAQALVTTNAKVKLEKAAEANAKCKLTIDVGGKTITMTDIAADGKYKDTKVEVKAAAAPAA